MIVMEGQGIKIGSDCHRLTRTSHSHLPLQHGLNDVRAREQFDFRSTVLRQVQTLKMFPTLHPSPVDTGCCYVELRYRLHFRDCEFPSLNACSEGADCQGDMTRRLFLPVSLNGLNSQVHLFTFDSEPFQHMLAA